MRGFTLIELLVVIVIIGLLSGIGIESFQGSIQRANDAKRISDATSIMDAVDRYYLDHNAFPLPATAGNFATNCSDTPTHEDINTVLAPLVTEGYLEKIPSDSKGNWPYCYMYQAPSNYVHCNNSTQHGAVLIIATEASAFSSSTEYALVGENGSEHRYCMYSKF